MFRIVLVLLVFLFISCSKKYKIIELKTGDATALNVIYVQKLNNEEEIFELITVSDDTVIGDKEKLEVGKVYRLQLRKRSQFKGVTYDPSENSFYANEFMNNVVINKRYHCRQLRGLYLVKE